MISDWFEIVDNNLFEPEYCFERRLSINFVCEPEIRLRDVLDLKISANASIGPVINAIATDMNITLRIKYAFWSCEWSVIHF